MNEDETLVESVTLSCGFNTPNSLKTLKERFGGCLKGSEPKLKRHCWKLMNDAAGKNPVLKKGKGFFKSVNKNFQLTHLKSVKTSFSSTFASTPSRLNTISFVSTSMKHPQTLPDFQVGKFIGIDFALCHTSFRQPSNETLKASSPIP